MTVPGPDLYLFPVPESAGTMERHAGAVVAGLTPIDPLTAGYGHALILAGRNLDRAEQGRDSGKVDRALSRWVELLGKLAATQPKTEGARRDHDGDAPTEFDRYARAVDAAATAGPPGISDPQVPGSVL